MPQETGKLHSKHEDRSAAYHLAKRLLVHSLPSEPDDPDDDSSMEIIAAKLGYDDPAAFSDDVKSLTQVLLAVQKYYGEENE